MIEKQDVSTSRSHIINVTDQVRIRKRPERRESNQDERKDHDEEYRINTKIVTSQQFNGSLSNDT